MADLNLTGMLMRMSLPAIVKAALVQVLCQVFAEAFDVEAPDVVSISRRAAAKGEGGVDDRPDLKAFREFSSACMEAALESPLYAATCKERLFAGARDLGARLAHVLRPAPEQLAALVFYCYDQIDICVVGSIPGTLVFERCSFAQGYTPQLCSFMSAFDSGFVAGLCSVGGLDFQARITQGDPCCVAQVLDAGAGMQE